MSMSLRTLRAQRGWSQLQLAASADVSLKTLYKIESGRAVRVQGRTIRALSAALGVAPADVAEFRPSLGLPADSDG